MAGAADHLDAAIRALKAKTPKDAVPPLRAFLALEPDEPDAWSLLAETLTALGEAEAALEALDRTLTLSPQDDGALFHRAKVLDDLERPQQALVDQEALAERHPTNTNVLHNLALLRRHAGDTEGSEAVLRRLLTLAPDRQDSRLALAHALLARGAWAEGFALYEARLALPGWQRAALTAPSWDGSALEGRSLLVTAEQGLGDGVQFLRYLPQISGAGRVIVECHAPLRRLIEAIPTVDLVVPFSPEGNLPPTDLRVALGSLPGLIAQGAPLEDAVPYPPFPLAPVTPPITETPRKGTGLALGMVWRSSDRPELRRDPPREALASLSACPGIRWTSLQWGDASPSFPPPFPMDMAPIAQARDLLDTARIIDSLDGVVTVDTVVAHLAGAMGKPCWVLLGSRPDWRWGNGAPITPWYPTARLFRREQNPWRTPLTALIDSLLEALVRSL
ncbi:tetratricopeptide repeat protein [Rhodospirillum sp. A1_3_36]|uniref:tetratricopeptide repeat protein n=1 Tax=Rhodospirillum sp. A1_3_36 TaxID=3391666 RepID=UPI0039A6DAED